METLTFAKNTPSNNLQYYNNNKQTLSNNYFPKSNITNYNNTQVLYTIADTYGLVPSSKTGSSITQVDEALYAVFGGRCYPSLNMSNQLNLFDIKTNMWHKQAINYTDNNNTMPKPRYFHSACCYKNRFLIIVGGQSLLFSDNVPLNNNTNQQFYANLFNDICIFDFQTQIWQVYDFNINEFSPRYAHISYIKDDSLVIIGGQNEHNEYIKSIDVFDLNLKQFVKKITIDLNIGSYRSSCVYNKTNNLSYLYSNMNFSNVLRELYAIDSDFNLNKISINNEKSEALPPGLRFPKCDIIDNSLVVSGIYLSTSLQSYSMWKFDLENATFSEMPLAKIPGSFGSGCLNEKLNTFILFGNKDRIFIRDYEERRVNFTQICSINMETYGILKKPLNTCSIELVKIGLNLMNNLVFGDIDIVTDNNEYVIKVNRAFLKTRWPNYAKYIRPSDKNNVNNSGVMIVFDHKDQSVLRYFVEYLHTLQINQVLSLETYGKLLVFACKYQTNYLHEYVSYKLKSMMNIENAIDIYNIADNANHTGLKYCSLKLMIENKNYILENDQVYLNKCNNAHLIYDLMHRFPLSPKLLVEAAAHKHSKSTMITPNKSNSNVTKLKNVPNTLEVAVNNLEPMDKITEETNTNNNSHSNSRRGSSKSNDSNLTSPIFSADNLKKAFFGRFMRRPSAPLVNIKGLNKNNNSNKHDVAKINNMLNESGF